MPKAAIGTFHKSAFRSSSTRHHSTIFAYWRCLSSFQLLDRQADGANLVMFGVGGQLAGDCHRPCDARVNENSDDFLCHRLRLEAVTRRDLACRHPGAVDSLATLPDADRALTAHHCFAATGVARLCTATRIPLPRLRNHAMSRHLQEPISCNRGQVRTSFGCFSWSPSELLGDQVGFGISSYAEGRVSS